MIINYPDTVENDKTIFDVEEEGRCNIVLIAVRYTGPRSSVPAARYQTDAGWPGHSPLQARENGELPGPPQGALIPDWIHPDAPDSNRTVEVLEADEDVEVFYTRRDIARAMLETNYLDPQVFGRGYNDDVREKVLGFLGIDYEGTDERVFREELREVAGIEVDEEKVRAEARDTARVTDYRRNYPRDDLVDAARILGFEDEEGLDPAAAGRIQLATFLADQDREAVRFAFEGKADAARATNAGEAPDPGDEWDAEAAVDVYDFDELKAVVKSVREGPGEFSLRGVSNEDMAAFLVETKGLSEAEIDGHLTG